MCVLRGAVSDPHASTTAARSPIGSSSGSKAALQASRTSATSPPARSRRQRRSRRGCGGALAPRAEATTQMQAFLLPLALDGQCVRRVLVYASDRDPAAGNAVVRAAGALLRAVHYVVAELAKASCFPEAVGAAFTFQCQALPPAGPTMGVAATWGCSCCSPAHAASSAASAARNVILGHTARPYRAPRATSSARRE